MEILLVVLLVVVFAPALLSAALLALGRVLSALIPWRSARGRRETRTRTVVTVTKRRRWYR